MTDQVPFYINLSFIAITLITLVGFYRASNKNKGAILIVLVLALVQALLSQKGFFLVTDAIPPRLIFILLPSIVLILIAFYTKPGKRLIASFDMEKYTYLHSVRIGVEIVLYYLFVYALIPESMTFSGRNFDVLAGLTAPFVAYFGIRKGKMSDTALLIWNWVCLLLVSQVVITGILSAPTPFQQLSLNEPNTGILYFPFVWLPGIVVPIVMLGHMVAIKNLNQKRRAK
jgi:hypothetical protein